MKYPTKKQKEALNEYIQNDGDFSIYGKDGIYAELENLLKEKYNRKFCILTNTGTSALSSAYFGLNLKKGDKVIVPVYTFIATVTPFLRIGCDLIFADADKKTGQISLEGLEELVDKKTKALVVTHMWGVSADVEEITEFCKRHNLKLIEDTSHAHFTEYKDKLLGTFGEVSCFSVGAKKIISGGEGGFLLTDDEEIYIRATLLGHFVERAKEALNDVSPKVANKYRDYTSGFGENYRMHPYSAVMIKALIENEIEEIIEKRYKIYSYFANLIKREIKGMEIHPIQKGAIYGFKPKLQNHDPIRFISEMKKRELKIKIPDTKPLYADKLFKDFFRSGFKLDYKGAKEYMRGRISVSDFTTGNLEQDLRKVEEYIKAFKEVLNK